MSYMNRLCLVTDVKGYSTHTAPEQADAQRRLAQVMRFACRTAGIRWVSSKDRQDRGDGRLYVFSPKLDDTLAIPRLLIGLRHGLYESNRTPGPFGRMRLRAAMARGIIGYGATGYLGQAPITACRLVDSQQLKDRIEVADAVDLAFIVPDDLFHDVIKQDFPGLPSGEFTKVDVSVKEFSGPAWVYLPDAGPVLPPGNSDALWAGVLVAGAAGTGVLTWVVMPESDSDVDTDDYGHGSDFLDRWEHEHGEEHDPEFHSGTDFDFDLGTDDDADHDGLDDGLHDGLDDGLHDGLDDGLGDDADFDDGDDFFGIGL
jgi:hypothetical protein